MNNPLLHDSGLPAFAEIRPEFVTPAIDALLADANAALERVVKPNVPPDFDAMSTVFAITTKHLSRA
jgi:oligopeptidase A